MNFYTLTYDDSLPTLQQLNVPTNSDYKIGIKVIGSKDAGKIVGHNQTTGDVAVLAQAFNLYPQQVTLVGDDGSTISADPKLTNGYVTFTLKAGDEANFAKYKVQVKNDTFDGIQYSPIMEGTNTSPRVRNIPCNLSCDTPTTIYPSDKLQTVGKDGKMYPVYGNFVPYFFTVRNSAGQTLYDSTYRIYPYSTNYTSSGASLGIYRNNFVMNETEQGYDIAPKYTDEMIADGDTLVIATQTAVAAHKEYYIHFAVIPYENTFDLAVNTFKSQQGILADINFDNTVNIAGTLSDDTEFSYNALVK